MPSKARLTKILGLEKVWNQKYFWKKNYCHDKILWQFPDIDQMAKIP